MSLFFFFLHTVELKKVNPTTLPPSPPPPIIPWARVISSVLLFILYNGVLVLCIYTYRKWARGKNIQTPEIQNMICLAFKISILCTPRLTLTLFFLTYLLNAKICFAYSWMPRLCYVWNQIPI